MFQSWLATEPELLPESQVSPFLTFAFSLNHPLLCSRRRQVRKRGRLLFGRRGELSGHARVGAGQGLPHAGNGQGISTRLFYWALSETQQTGTALLTLQAKQCISALGRDLHENTHPGSPTPISNNLTPTLGFFFFLPLLKHRDVGILHYKKCYVFKYCEWPELQKGMKLASIPSSKSDSVCGILWKFWVWVLLTSNTRPPLHLGAWGALLGRAGGFQSDGWWQDSSSLDGYVLPWLSMTS